ncbi:type I DNA topoisomerase [Candidatus Vondammii sp. HM_W22]|uniref:type I DNA topoisomerase n=1 Tax=Candidatus Vondammii sp. HM_W22 TaxID=2687299 RepID=UPI001F13128B|nr:type I DNA topoisomerase [Candidatus Vondammii sp. HM_W22]
MGVEAPDFKPEYQPTDRGAEVIRRLRGLVASASEVYLATDPDREGEAIAWHLEDALKLTNPRRVTFGEITKTEVRAAIAAPREIDMQQVAAQEGRRVLDRLVGYTVSPIVSNHTGTTGLSAGRVQTPAVRLVLDREREIKSFSSTQHYGAELTFSNTWTAQWLTKTHLEEGGEYFQNEAFAKQIAEIRSVNVVSCEEKTAKQSPPPPFITSTLQQAASHVLKMNPKQAMQVAQKLYEQGAITYMRTDSPNLSEEAITAIYGIAETKGLPAAEKPRKWKAKADAQEAHEAIRPSNFSAERAGETVEEQALYRLIWNRAVACQLAEAEYAVRTALLQAQEPIDGRVIQFEAKGRKLTSPGWKALVEQDQSEEKEKEKTPNPVPKLEAGNGLTANAGRLLTKKTKAPKRFTEASLIKELEKRGIGRPSTYAAIMENIIHSKNYITVDKSRFLVPTDKAALVIDSLRGHFGFLDYEFTRSMEADLDQVAIGQASYKKVVSECHSQLVGEVEEFTCSVAPKYPCLECGKPMLKRKGKPDKATKKKTYFWGCSAYPECNHSLPDDNGQPGIRALKKPPVLSDHKCPDCSGPLVKRNGQKGVFWGCSAFPKCDLTLPDDNGVPGKRVAKAVPVLSEHKCPDCSKPLVHRVKKGAGAFDFWGCSGYPVCETTMNNKDGVLGIFPRKRT